MRIRHATKFSSLPLRTSLTNKEHAHRVAHRVIDIQMHPHIPQWFVACSAACLFRRFRPLFFSMEAAAKGVQVPMATAGAVR